MTATPNDIPAARRQLLNTGWQPIPTVGKAPRWKGWSDGDITDERLADIEAAYPDHTNTGIRTGACVAIDIDLKDRPHAMEIEKVVEATLGETRFRRVGSKGCTLCYQNETPITKITIGTREKRLVEMLGSGQQFVAYGVHPDTGAPYDWTNDFLGGEPLATPFSDVPAVTPEQLYKAARIVAERLISLGYGDVKVSGIKTASGPVSTPPAASGKPTSPAIVERMLRHIDPAGDRNVWLIVCGGLVSAPIADPSWDGLDLFIKWSRGDLHGGAVPANYKGPDDCEAQWQRDVEKLHER